jgi:hypothetical protein
MASRMVTSHGPQIAQMNEESTPESSLNLTLMQHLRDENPERERCTLVLKSIPFELVIIAFL